MLFGASGFAMIINFLQAIGMSFVIWSLVLFLRHYVQILSTYGNFTYAFIIPGLVIYTVVYSYLLSISLRWYTIIASVFIFYFRLKQGKMKN